MTIYNCRGFQGSKAIASLSNDTMHFVSIELIEGFKSKFQIYSNIMTYFNRNNLYVFIFSEN